MPTLGGYQGPPGPLRLHAPRKFIALIFEKPSLRTRVTFDVGIQSMGGSVVFLDHTQASASLGAESIADVARNSTLGAGHSRAFTIAVLEKWRRTPHPRGQRAFRQVLSLQALPISYTGRKFGALRGFSSHTSRRPQTFAIL